MKNDSPYCPFCGHRAIFETYMDINLCDVCGAHETVKGWQSRDIKAKKKKTAKDGAQLRLFIVKDEGWDAT